MESVFFYPCNSEIFFHSLELHARSVLLFLLHLEVHHLVYLFGAVAEQTLQITDEPVDVALSGGLQDDVLVVVVPAAKTNRSTDYTQSIEFFRRAFSNPDIRI